MIEERTITVALAGQPNVGKSTVFNLLTGLSQHVGNWPGKTVERKEGIYSHNGIAVHIVDLPGTYSLTANSAEELIARDYIIKERPDVVVAVLDAAAMERNLYLVAELLPLPSPVVVALNMMDVAQQQGLQIEPEVLEVALGVPVVPLVATKNQGIRELVGAIDEMVQDGTVYEPKRPEIRDDHRAVLDEIKSLIASCVPEPYPVDWVSLKLLEGDAEIMRTMKDCLPEDIWEKVYAILMEHEDAIVAVASGRYDWIGRMTRAALVRPGVGQITLTERLDRWATHPFGGLIILAGILGLIFWLTYAVGAPLQDLLETHVVQTSAQLVSAALMGAPDWLVGLLVDGIIGGVGTMLTFIPILLIFFAFMGLLEDTGYMARAGYVMDRFMHLMGLHGKSFLPLFLGFGCNVPAVMGTRVIESRRGRLLTIMLAPLVPCTARMMVLAFITPPLFRRGSSACGLGPGRLEPGGFGHLGHSYQQGRFRGRAGRLYHGTASLPCAQLAHHRLFGLATFPRLLQAGWYGDSGCVSGALGAFDPADRRDRDQFLGSNRPVPGSSRCVDGVKLADDGSPVRQLHRQGELHRRIEHPLRRG